jgi:hypothetical protein
MGDIRMKILITCFLFFSNQIFSQNYLNFRLTDGTDRHIQLSDLQKITISPSGDQINIYHNDGTSVTQNIADLLNMSLGETGLGVSLPVELSSLNASVIGMSVHLNWITKTEVNNYGFQIERAVISNESINLNWEKIGFVPGHGNSNSPKEYSFSDLPKVGTQFQYRLKQIDTDGKFEYSAVINIEIANPNEYELKQNTPNPFNPSTIIAYSLPHDGSVSLIVYDIIGREVASLVNEYQKGGNYSIIFDGSKLSSGVYICKLGSDKFSASIKMILIK